MAVVLQARGVAPGTHVGVLGPTTRPLVTALQAVWLAGGTLVTLPLPMRLGSIEAFVDQTRRRIVNADAPLVLIDPDLAPFLPVEPGDPFTTLTLDELYVSASTARDSRYEQPPADPDRLAILQFTSGSTADPKGVMLPDRCVVENIDAIIEAAGLGPSDRVVSWLPLYHDMGLIGLLMTPMLHGFELVLGAPQDFLAAPANWLEWISTFHGTITAGPNFSYALVARAYSAPVWAHSTCRRGDSRSTVRSRSIPARWRPSARDAAPHGFDAKAAFPVFGMAEATLAVTFPEPGLGMAVDHVDRASLEHERYAAATSATSTGGRRLALLGRAVRGFELRVVEPESGRVLGEREVGELELRGPSVTPGYYRNDAATTAAFRDGWFRTGDLAYLVDAQLVVCGRLKDMIIVGGRNVFPEDVERAAAAVDGVRAGNVIVLGSDRRKGREAIVVVAEAKSDDLGALRDAVAAVVTDAVGVPPAEIVLVRAGSLPKTSSGKLQRSLCRERYLDDQLDLV